MSTMRCDSQLPLVSVVLPTFNRAATLDRSIQSVLRQSFGDFELIVVDDGSTDATDLVLNRYRDCDNIKILCESHRGCAAARNRGIEASRGRFIAFQDSDDEWLPHKLATAMEMLQESGPEVGGFYSDMIRVQEADKSALYFQSPPVQRGVLINEATFDYQTYRVGIGSAVIKRECFQTVGTFDEALPRLIDLDLFIRLADNYQFVHCQQALIKYYVGDSISSNHRALLTARLHLLRKYEGRLKRNKHHLAHQYLQVAKVLKENDQALMSCAFTIRALLTAPLHASIRAKVLKKWQRKRREEAAAR